MSIPFELFVTYPNNYLNKISKLLNIQINKKVLKELKRQKVPRKKISDSWNKNLEKYFLENSLDWKIASI